MNASELFDEAAAEGRPLGGLEAQVGRVTAQGIEQRVWVGTDGRGRRAAYFEISGDGRPSFSVSRVISVETVVVDEEASSERIPTAKVTCHEPKLNDVFAVFIDEILDRMSSETDAVDVIVSSADDWRSLLQIASAGLSESVAKGLFGELCFLESLVSENGPGALAAWQRFPNDVHDFAGDRARVEVKTSAFQDRAAVTVHGLRQLERPVDAVLTLAVAEVQPHGGETIDDLVERILALGVDRTSFLRKLSDAGFVRGMPGASELNFTLRSWRYWEIDESSPVLSVSALTAETADAVSRLSYSLNLSALGDFEVAFDYGQLLVSSRDCA